MTKILRIDSSSRIKGSHSRELADYFQATWLNKHPEDKVIVRDVAQNPCPHISTKEALVFEHSLEELTEEMKAEIALSEQLINEILTADILLISTPMYNFSVPSALKAWIDQIVRGKKTFDYDGNNFFGLLTDKKAYIICTYGVGGYTKNSAPSSLNNFETFSNLNFLEPYLDCLLTFLGIPEIKFFNLEATEDKESITQNKARVKQAINNTISGY